MARDGFFGELVDLCRAVGKAMGVTFVNFLRKPVTVHYPDVKRDYPDRFRGVLALTYDKETGEENCIGCRLCEYICPPQVIKVEMLKAEKRNWAKTFTLELYACEFCELCVQVCPTDAIIMMKSFDLATSDRRELLARQGPSPRHRPPVRALLGHRQRAPRHAGAAQAREGRGRPRQGRGDPGGRRRVSLEPIAFWALAVVLVASALAVVLTKNLFHSVLYLALALTGTAGIFLTLDAEFLAAVQLLLYAGGLITIAVFAIVVTERLVGTRLSQTSRHLFNGAIVAGAVLVALLSFIGRAVLPDARPPMDGDLTRAIGEAVLTRFVLPFEILGVLFLAALLGATYFARPDD